MTLAIKRGNLKGSVYSINIRFNLSVWRSHPHVNASFDAAQLMVDVAYWKDFHSSCFKRRVCRDMNKSHFFQMLSLNQVRHAVNCDSLKPLKPEIVDKIKGEGANPRDGDVNKESKVRSEARWASQTAGLRWERRVNVTSNVVTAIEAGFTPQAECLWFSFHSFIIFPNVHLFPT